MHRPTYLEVTLRRDEQLRASEYRRLAAAARQAESRAERPSPRPTAFGFRIALAR